jgi:SAM-dependent methyltransferase
MIPKKTKEFLMKRSREKKYNYIINTTKPSELSSILDVGCADIEYSLYDNYFEKRYPFPENITALSIYPLEQFKKRYKNIKAVTYDGSAFPFEDKDFSIVISNAVIEHVGGIEDQLFFIKELGRVGQQFVFTTPAKEFPIEIHTNYPFIHWLPASYFDKLISLLGKPWAAGNYMHLLNRHDIESLMQSAKITDYIISTIRFGPFPIHYNVWGRK